MKVLFPDGYVVRLNLKGEVLSTKNIGFRNCITPGCTKTFRRFIYPPSISGEKEHHSRQCHNLHRVMKMEKSA